MFRFKGTCSYCVLFGLAGSRFKKLLNRYVQVGGDEGVCEIWKCKSRLATVCEAAHSNPPALKTAQIATLSIYLQS